VGIDPQYAGAPAGGKLPEGRTARVLGLFMAALLVAAAGCGTDTASPHHVHVDRNNDGYCDEDGEPMPAAGARHAGSPYYGSTYYGLPRSGGSLYAPSQTTGRPATISSGVPRGGVGGSAAGGGG